jgi:prepilin-type processing-associated H-X9-DG protein
MNGVSLAKPNAPAETIAIVETRYYPPDHPWHNPNWGWYIGFPPSADGGKTGADPPNWPWSVWLNARRHNDGMNVSFVDGHSKFQRHDYVTRGAQIWMWNGQGRP